MVSRIEDLSADVTIQIVSLGLTVAVEARQGTSNIEGVRVSGYGSSRSSVPPHVDHGLTHGRPTEVGKDL